jgi:hypothetical protein
MPYFNITALISCPFYPEAAVDGFIALDRVLDGGAAGALLEL